MINKLNICVLGLSFFCGQELGSQTSVVQDSKGETGLTFGNMGVVAINAKDESISFSYGRSLQQPNPPAPLNNPDYFGIAVKAKGKNSLFSVMKKNDFQYDGSIGIFYFKDFNQNNNLTIQPYFNADFLFAQFKLYDSLRNFSKEIYDYNSRGFKISGGLNLSFPLINNRPCYVGIAANFGRKNNSNDLKPVEITSFYTITDTTTQQVKLVQRDVQSGFDKKVFRDDINYANLNIDIGPRLLSQFLVLFHSRISIQNDRATQWNPAFGLYFTRTGAPLEVVAGVQIQNIDYFDTMKTGKTLKERSLVNVVAGFTF